MIWEWYTVQGGPEVIAYFANPAWETFGHSFVSNQGEQAESEVDTDTDMRHYRSNEYRDDQGWNQNRH
jgi:hypothetical protein